MSTYFLIFFSFDIDTENFYRNDWWFLTKDIRAGVKSLIDERAVLTTRNCDN